MTVDFGKMQQEKSRRIHVSTVEEGILDQPELQVRTLELEEILRSVRERRKGYSGQRKENYLAFTCPVTYMS
jgi:hypothetical protein